jgi:hypothetical protein
MRAIFHCIGGMLLLTSLSAAAQVVECVDANGKKIYAQTCPDDAEKKRDIAVPQAPAKPAGDASWKQKESDFEARRQERLKAEAKQNEKDQHAKQSVQRCADARSKLDMLESGRQTKRVDPITGEHVPLDSGQRQTELDQLHDDIQNNCQ